MAKKYQMFSDVIEVSLSNLYTKHSVHLWAFFTFLTISSNFIDFGLIGKDVSLQFICNMPSHST